MNKLNKYFKIHKSQLQVAWFLVFGLCALLAQLVSRIICDIVFQDLVNTITIWPFPSQTLGSFLAFLISNIIAKVISFITNRKKTFQANNNIYFSIIVYVILVVVLIIVETIIGTPLQNAIYIIMGGNFINATQASVNASSQVLYQTCGVISQLIYGIGDAIIVFFMDKYLIMKRS
ncbi:MAG: hypothetical protein LUH02_07410 [Erysipelotrichaceae bacterium]|nr:hypothetical protein [Erysipelotrichaceae bacterium]